MSLALTVSLPQIMCNDWLLVSVRRCDRYIQIRWSSELTPQYLSVGIYLEKPLIFTRQKETLSLLSGTQHSVFTGVCIANASAQKQQVCETKVEFCPLSAAQIRSYWESGEPQGKAGCYAIQGLGSVFVKSIHGSYSNVVGLPVHEVSLLLRDFGIKVLN